MWSAGSIHIEIHYDFLTYLTKPVQTCTDLYNACTTCTIDTGVMPSHSGMLGKVPSHAKVVVQVPDVTTFDLRAQGGVRVTRCAPGEK